MKLYVTEIIAIRPSDGEMITYCGPEVPGLTAQDAQDYCENNGLGYCKVLGELICEIACKPGTHEPDFNNMIDYEQPSLN